MKTFMQRVAGLVALTGSLFAAGCVHATAPVWKVGNPVVGQAVARDLCSGCHAVGREGLSPNPKAPLFREVLSGYRPDRLAEDLNNATAIAHTNMPTFHFGDEHAYDLVAYLLTIQEKPFAPPAY